MYKFNLRILNVLFMSRLRYDSQTLDQGVGLGQGCIT